jgi:hypothetical protein
MGERPGEGDSGASEIDAIAARCRANAEAARWAAERQRRIREGYGWTDDDAPDGPAIVAWAERLTDAFYWANAADSAAPPDIRALDLVAGCFETVAEALAFADAEQARPSGLERALRLLAEAQSALRQALRKLQVSDDSDQLAVYEWLRETAARHRDFLKRFMRADDLANPADWAALLERIEAASGSRPQSQRQRAMFDFLLSHVGQMREHGEGTTSEWQSLIRGVEDVVDAGLAPSNRELRELLLPVIDELPDQEELPRGFRLVARELDRFLATRQPALDPAKRPAQTGEVQQAARLLSGRSVVLIGGVRRPDAQKLLKSALRLNELVWVETKEHQSIKRFESTIARDDMALVLLAIRWSSHGFGDVKQFCDLYRKPLVRLPGGYGPNQVAAQIITQAGEILSQAGEILSQAGEQLGGISPTF